MARLISVQRWVLVFATVALGGCPGGGDGEPGAAGTGGSPGGVGVDSGTAADSGADLGAPVTPAGPAGTPTDIATFPDSRGIIAANATHVYFDVHGSVSRVPVAGGPIEPVIQGNQGVSSIALDDTSVFVLDNGGFTVSNGAIKSVAFAGIPGAYATTIMNQSNVSDLITAGGDVVWISSTLAATTVKSLPKVVTVPATVPAVVANLGNQAWFAGMASVGADVYYAHRIAMAMGVSSAPRAGGGAATILLMGQAPNIQSFTADAEGVYFTTGTGGNDNAKDGKLWKAPLAGGAPTMLAAGINAPGRIVVYGANVYWLDAGTYETNYKQGSINKVAKAGGAATVVVTGLDSLAKNAYALSGDTVFVLAAAPGAIPITRLIKVAK